MQKIDERSLKLQADEYFDYCKNRRIRGLWVITDKQSIFYSQVLKDDFRNHNNIEVDIENEIHPNMQIEGWDAIRPSHAYIASAGVELEIYMPDNGKLSYSQAKFIIDILNIVEKFNGEVPDNMEDLTSIPGVGRKSANVIMLEAFHNPQGIAVDTHAKRIANRIGFSNESDPLKIEQDLLKVIPKEYYYDVNHLLVWHGRNTCTARNPKCEECALKDLCNEYLSVNRCQ